MLTTYRPGDSIWHRLPTLPKTLVLGVLVIGTSILPSALSWYSVMAAAAACLCCYAVPGIGLALLLRQVLALRWLLLITLAGQLVFSGLPAAAINTTRVAAVLLISCLAAATTPSSQLLHLLDRAMQPLSRAGVNPRNAALMLMVTLATLPHLFRAAEQVREAQRARGGRPNLRRFLVPYLILTLKHADELGDAIAMRGTK